MVFGLGKNNKNKQSKMEEEPEKILRSVARCFYSVDRREKDELKELTNAKNYLIHAVNEINHGVEPNVDRNSHRGVVLYPGMPSTKIVRKHIDEGFKKSVDELEASIKHARKIEKICKRIYRKLERLRPEDHKMGRIEKRILSVEHSFEHDIKVAINLIDTSISHFERIMKNAEKDGKHKETCSPNHARDDSIFFIGHSSHSSPMHKIEEALGHVNKVLDSFHELFELEHAVKKRLSFWQRHNLDHIVTKIKK